jgi:hypothetical protein
MLKNEFSESAMLFGSLSTGGVGLPNLIRRGFFKKLKERNFG